MMRSGSAAEAPRAGENALCEAGGSLVPRLACRLAFLRLTASVAARMAREAMSDCT